MSCQKKKKQLVFSTFNNDIRIQQCVMELDLNSLLTNSTSILNQKEHIRYEGKPIMSILN